MSWLRFSLAVICLLVVFLEFGSCRRYSYRFYRASYRSYYRSSYYRSSYYSSTTSLTRRYSSSTVRRGTSPYTRSNWLSYGSSIYGYSLYLRTRRYYDSPNDMPTVCNNQYDNSPNGTVYGYFICPRDGEDDDMDTCCGEDNREYCCRPGDDPSQLIGIIAGSLIGAGVLAGVTYLFIRHMGGCKSTSAKKTSPSTNSTAPRNTYKSNTVGPTPSAPPEGAGPSHVWKTSEPPTAPPQGQLYQDPAYPPSQGGAYPSQPPPPYTY